MSVLLDTNLLLRSIQPDHQHYAAATGSILKVRQTESLYIVPQILYEFWAVSTRPEAENGLGMTPQQARAELDKARSLFTFVPDTPAVFDQWQQLITQHEVKGKNSHDARLVAAMNVHGIAKILTFNTQDFSRFPGIEIIHPESVGQTNK